VSGSGAFLARRGKKRSPALCQNRTKCGFEGTSVAPKGVRRSRPEPNASPGLGSANAAARAIIKGPSSSSSTVTLASNAVVQVAIAPSPRGRLLRLLRPGPRPRMRHMTTGYPVHRPARLDAARSAIVRSASDTGRLTDGAGGVLAADPAAGGSVLPPSPIVSRMHNKGWAEPARRSRAAATRGPSVAEVEVQPEEVLGDLEGCRNSGRRWGEMSWRLWARTRIPGRSGTVIVQNPPYSSTSTMKVVRFLAAAS
jgi:hypothetical protein